MGIECTCLLQANNVDNWLLLIGLGNCMQDSCVSFWRVDGIMMDVMLKTTDIYPLTFSSHILCNANRHRFRAQRNAYAIQSTEWAGSRCI